MYDSQYIPNSYNYPLDGQSNVNQRYEEYKLYMFGFGMMIGLIMLCCIGAIFTGVLFIFYSTYRYWREYVSKREEMYDNVSIESEIDQV